MGATGRFPLAATGVVLAALLVLPLCVPVTLATQIAIFATGTLSVTLLLGAVGLLSFGQGLYFGVGAYVGGLLVRDLGLGLLPALLAAAAAAAILGGLLGSVIVRRHGVYFVMLTLGRTACRAYPASSPSPASPSRDRSPSTPWRPWPS